MVDYLKLSILIEDKLLIMVSLYFPCLSFFFDSTRKLIDFFFTRLGYPLRPEMIESNLYLYQATKDEFYLELAEEVLRDLRNKTMVPCGLATILDLQTGELKDEQPSFAISETLKYLYLTFDEVSLSFLGRSMRRKILIFILFALPSLVKSIQ